MGHCLGIGTGWSLKGMLTGKDTADPEFTGPKATAAYNQLFGTSAASVPVEAGGGSGTANVHWRDSTFANELMTGYYSAGQVNPISAVSVGSLADIGYAVNMGAAEPYTPPGHIRMVFSQDAVQLPNGLILVGDVRAFRHRKRFKVSR